MAGKDAEKLARENQSSQQQDADLGFEDSHRLDRHSSLDDCHHEEQIL